MKDDYVCTDRLLEALMDTLEAKGIICTFEVRDLAESRRLEDAQRANGTYREPTDEDPI